MLVLAEHLALGTDQHDVADANRLHGERHACATHRHKQTHTQPQAHTHTAIQTDIDTPTHPHRDTQRHTAW